MFNRIVQYFKDKKTVAAMANFSRLFAVIKMDYRLNALFGELDRFFTPHTPDRTIAGHMLMRALFGENVKNSEVADFSKQWIDFNTKVLVPEFNRTAGGEALALNINENFYIPQFHPAKLLRSKGKDFWIKTISGRVIDIDGSVIPDRGLDKIYDKIVDLSNLNYVPNWVFRKRCMKFRSADDWLYYHWQIHISVYFVLITHLFRMTRRTKIMERIGTDPQGFGEAIIKTIGVESIEDEQEKTQFKQKIDKVTKELMLGPEEGYFCENEFFEKFIFDENSVIQGKASEI